MKLAVIPARGGSKRVPRKNIREFCGQPIIAWPLQAALSSGCFDHVVVSTDDPEIACVAKAYGADVPFMRPANLSDDFTPTIPVIRHAIDWFEDRGEIATEACCIYATAPFVRPSDIQAGLSALESTGGDYAVTVTPYSFPIQRALLLTDAGRVQMFQPEHFNTRSQDLPVAYHDAAQFYWGRYSAWTAAKPFFTSAAVPIILPRERVQDIDTLEDWRYAELMFDALRRERPCAPT